MAAKKKPIYEEDVKKWIERGVKRLENLDCSDKKRKSKVCGTGSGGCFWFLGFVGALIYFWQYVDSFGTGVFAIIKACTWPAFLILHLFRFLKI